MQRQMFSRAAFSLIEAMVALSLTAMAGSVLLLATEGMLKTTNDTVDQTIAQGMAAQLLDEVVGLRYCDGANARQTTLGPSSTEYRGERRDRYNDIDDFHGYTALPPKDRSGGLVGQGDGFGTARPAALRSSNTEFQKWRQKVEVYYVRANDPQTRLAEGQTSDYRAVEVTIDRTEINGSVRTLAKARRVICYIPTP